MTSTTSLRRLGTVVGAAIATAYGGTVLLHSPISANDNGGGFKPAGIRERIRDPNTVVPSREAQQSSLIGATSANPLDILVIGGGATGSGVALDAVTRGLRVGLIEREDFASGTSSRSTKLLHGGTYVRKKLIIYWLVCENCVEISLFIIFEVLLWNYWSTEESKRIRVFKWIK